LARNLQEDEAGVSPAWREIHRKMKWAYLLFGEKAAREYYMEWRWIANG
jgi:hypothetical protein